jgi:hypothetical protein
MMDRRDCKKGRVSEVWNGLLIGKFKIELQGVDRLEEAGASAERFRLFSMFKSI